MRNHHKGLSLLIDGCEEVHHAVATAGIKRSGWLVGEQYCWPIDQSASDGDTLALAS